MSENKIEIGRVWPVYVLVVVIAYAATLGFVAERFAKENSLKKTPSNVSVRERARWEDDLGMRHRKMQIPEITFYRG